MSQVTRDIHLHMSQLSDFVESLLLAGIGAYISKKDLCEAFSQIPVHISQWPSQAVKIFGATFLMLKMTYGDRQVGLIVGSMIPRVQQFPFSRRVTDSHAATSSSSDA